MTRVKWHVAVGEVNMSDEYFRKCRSLAGTYSADFACIFTYMGTCLKTFPVKYCLRTVVRRPNWLSDVFPVIIAEHKAYWTRRMRECFNYALLNPIYRSHWISPGSDRNIIHILNWKFLAPYYLVCWNTRSVEYRFVGHTSRPYWALAMIRMTLYCDSMVARSTISFQWRHRIVFDEYGITIFIRYIVGMVWTPERVYVHDTRNKRRLRPHYAASPSTRCTYHASHNITK